MTFCWFRSKFLSQVKIGTIAREFIVEGVMFRCGGRHTDVPLKEVWTQLEFSFVANIEAESQYASGLARLKAHCPLCSLTATLNVDAGTMWKTSHGPHHGVNCGHHTRRCPWCQARARQDGLVGRS